VMTGFRHRPVLLHESIHNLNLSAGSITVDGTVGGGGHAAAILEASAPDGVLIGLDLDPEARAAAASNLASFGDRVKLVSASFRDVEDVLARLGIEAVDGILLDLGVSSHQIDTTARGFRFQEAENDPAPLDMRMDPENPTTAASLLRSASAKELQTLFQEYGELPGSKRLATAIVETRDKEPIETTADLLRVIRDARIGGGRKHNPATLVFQALRIAVNDELVALDEAIDAAIRVLRPGGRLVIISYHSLEDRIVKHRMRAAAKGCTCPPRTPICICGGVSTLQVITRRLVRPSDSETRDNPRARSSRLRAAERLEVA
jgi:16S rRNA (cytosine1402-N4)-methyltransferase